MTPGSASLQQTLTTYTLLRTVAMTSVAPSTIAAAAAVAAAATTNNGNSSEVRPTCPAPLFDEYFSRHGSECGAAEEHTGQDAVSQYPQQKPPQHPKRDDRPRRRRCVAKLSESKLTPTAEQSSTNLIVRKLSSRINEADLKRIFSPYGEILSAAVMRNIHTGENLGTAFVRYATTEQARAALKDFHGRFLYGRTISVHWARKQHDDAPVGEARRKIFKLFVRNIPLDVTAEDLARLFAYFGPVGNVTLHKDTASTGDKRLERRIAFVEYLHEGVAEKAAETIHNTRPFPSCRRIPLMVKLAEDHMNKRFNNVQGAQQSQATSPAKSSVATVSSPMNSCTHSSVSTHAYETEAPQFTQAVPQTTQDSKPAMTRNGFLGMRPTALNPALLMQSTNTTLPLETPGSNLGASPSANSTVSMQGSQQRYMHNPYSPVCPRLYLAVK